MATADATTAVEVVEATAIAMTTVATAEAVVTTIHALTATATAMPIVEETIDTVVASVVEEGTVAAATTGRPVDHQPSQPPAEAMPVILATRHRLVSTRSVAATIRIGGEVGSLA